MLNIKLPLILVTAFTLSGCITPDQREATIDITSRSAPLDVAMEVPEGTPARLVVYRSRGVEGVLSLLMKPEVTLNDAIIGKCIKGRKIDMEIAPGSYTLASESEFPNDRTFTIEAGETAYVRCGITVGLILPNIVLRFMDEAEGADAAATLRAQ